jgi:hypothetical protein
MVHTHCCCGARVLLTAGVLPWPCRASFLLPLHPLDYVADGNPEPSYHYDYCSPVAPFLGPGRPSATLPTSIQHSHQPAVPCLVPPPQLYTAAHCSDTDVRMQRTCQNKSTQEHARGNQEALPAEGCMGPVRGAPCCSTVRGQSDRCPNAGACGP